MGFSKKNLLLVIVVTTSVQYAAADTLSTLSHSLGRSMMGQVPSSPNSPAQANQVKDRFLELTKKFDLRNGAKRPSLDQLNHLKAHDGYSTAECFQYDRITGEYKTFAATVHVYQKFHYSGDSKDRKGLAIYFEPNVSSNRFKAMQATINRVKHNPSLSGSTNAERETAAEYERQLKKRHEEGRTKPDLRQVVLDEKRYWVDDSLHYEYQGPNPRSQPTQIDVSIRSIDDGHGGPKEYILKIVEEKTFIDKKLTDLETYCL